MISKYVKTCLGARTKYLEMLLDFPTEAEKVMDFFFGVAIMVDIFVDVGIFWCLFPFFFC